MILTGMLAHAAAMATPENRDVRSKERRSDTAGRDYGQKNS